MVEVHLYRVDDGLNTTTLSRGNFEKKYDYQDHICDNIFYFSLLGNIRVTFSDILIESPSVKFISRLRTSIARPVCEDCQLDGVFLLADVSLQYV